MTTPLEIDPLTASSTWLVFDARLLSSFTLSDVPAGIVTSLNCGLGGSGGAAGADGAAAAAAGTDGADGLGGAPAAGAVSVGRVAVVAAPAAGSDGAGCCAAGAV